MGGRLGGVTTTIDVICDFHPITEYTEAEPNMTCLATSILHLLRLTNIHRQRMNTVAVIEPSVQAITDTTAIFAFIDVLPYELVITFPQSLHRQR